MASLPRIVTEFPHEVKVVPHAWIPLADGTRLSAKLWLPAGAEDNPVPAVLEYIPYRKNDVTAARDHALHCYFAGHGFASARVDLRGSGDSEGILYDEYLPLEQSDALEVIAWLTSQPFCSGAVGMIGISWGGFNGLQVAAHSPPALKAVVSVCSTDDRYADDVHYVGGALHGEDMLGWASVMLGYNARPPDPDVVGASWREIWFDRMERTPPFLEAWTKHQRRDEFWKQGSVCEDYDAITCPVYMVGGWQDGYTNAVFRFLSSHRGPRKGLVGPWAHTYPNFGVPGPAIGFLQECVRWWECHLLGRDNGIMDEPQLRVFLREAMRPDRRPVERTGTWLAEPAWPSPNVTVSTARPAAGGSLVLDGTTESGRRPVPSSNLVGLDAGAWCSYGKALDGPGDQRLEDARSLVFDSPVLESDLALLGRPRATLELESDEPLAQVCVRLCDLWPDGASTLVSRGMLNLSHRHGHDEPAPMPTGHPETVVVELDVTGYRLPAGHRLRMAISSGYWPMMWPAPRPASLVLNCGPSTVLELPVRESTEDRDGVPAHFAQPESAPELPYDDLTRTGESNVLTRDAASGEHELAVVSRNEHRRLVDSRLEFGEHGRVTYRIVDGEPLSASVTSEQTHLIARGGWHTRVETRSALSATEEEWVLSNELDAFEGDERVFSKVWRTRVQRDHC